MYCQICHQPTRPLQRISKKANKIYHCCDNCDFISMDQADHLTADAAFQIYEQHQNSIEDPRYVAYFKHFIHAAILPQHHGSGRKGFDFGSGPEPVLAWILERDYGYTMDVYDLFYAPEKIYLNRQYDLITATEVIEHLPDPLAAFKLSHEHLKPDGLLAIMTLFHPQEDKSFLDWWYNRDPSHIAFFTVKTLATIAERVGLSLAYTDNRRYAAFRLR